MCDLDIDEHASAWSEHLVTRARKEHRCDTCCGPIERGSSYIVHFSIHDHSPNSEKQCLRCRTIALAFQREHRWMVTPGSLLEYLEQCLDEEPRWWREEDEDHDEDPLGVARNRLPSRLSDEGLRWKYAMEEIRARRAAARAA